MSECKDFSPELLNNYVCLEWYPASEQESLASILRNISQKCFAVLLKENRVVSKVVQGVLENQYIGIL